MKYLILSFVLYFSLPSLAQSNDSLLLDLQQTLSGSFSNFEQHEAQPDVFQHLRRHAVPIWMEKRDSGAYWLFVETEVIGEEGVEQSLKQLELYQLDKEKRIACQSFIVKDETLGEKLTGAWRLPERLKTISMSDFELMNCPSYFHKDSLSRFIGIFGICDSPNEEVHKVTYQVEASKNKLFLEEIAYDESGDIRWRQPLHFERQLTEYEKLRKEADGVKRDKDLSRLVDLLEGDFSNETQHSLYPNKVPLIRSHYRRIWNNRSNGLWVYVEDTRSKDGENWNLDRQLVMRYFIEDSSIKSEKYIFPEENDFVGAWEAPERLSDVTPEELRLRKDCPLEFRPLNKRSYLGVMANCSDPSTTADFTTTEMEVDKEGINILRRGFDEHGELIWENNFDLKRSE